MRTRKNHSRTVHAFTLVETLVAIGLLALALIGPMTLAHNMLQGARTTKEKLTASYLAQDALEYIKAVRDTNAAKGTAWLTGFDVCTSGCSVDTTVGTNAFTACPGGTCPVLRYSASGYYYGYTAGWTATPFTRKVTVTQTVPDVEARVDVVVSWKEQNVPQSFTLSRYFYNY